MANIQSSTAEIRRGKPDRKKEDVERYKSQGKNIMACPIPQSGHKETKNYVNKNQLYHCA